MLQYVNDCEVIINLGRDFAKEVLLTNVRSLHCDTEFTVVSCKWRRFRSSEIDDDDSE